MKPAILFKYFLSNFNFLFDASIFEKLESKVGPPQADIAFWAEATSSDK